VKTTNLFIERIHMRVKSPPPASGRAWASALGEKLLEQLAANGTLRGLSGEARIGSLEVDGAAGGGPDAMAVRIARSIVAKASG
jgi:hypothetical protein